MCIQTWNATNYNGSPPPPRNIGKNAGGLPDTVFRFDLTSSNMNNSNLVNQAEILVPVYQSITQYCSEG